MNETTDEKKEDSQIQMEEFWETNHKKKIKYWLSGSSLKDVIDTHHINIKELSGITVIEIGVGLGNMTIELHRIAESVIACDISQEALNRINPYCKATYLSKNLKDAEPVHIAICHLVFQHCNDEECYRIINDTQLLPIGYMSFQYAFLRENDNISDFTKNQIKNGTHYFRSPEKMRSIIAESNKKLLWESNPIEFIGNENFNWGTIKIINK